MEILTRVWRTTAGRRGLSVLMAGVIFAGVMIPTLGITTEPEAAEALTAEADEAEALTAGANEAEALTTEADEAEALTAGANEAEALTTEADEAAGAEDPAETTAAETASQETAQAAEPNVAQAAEQAVTPNQSAAAETEHIDGDDNAGDTTKKVQMFPEALKYCGSDSDIALTDEQVAEILEKLPADLPAERVGAVLGAYSLVGKVSYFWGGKSVIVGWDVRWGNPAYVVSAGSRSTGTLRTYGLDCSGYVNWVFSNTAGSNLYDLIGDGTTGQWNRSAATEWADARPGDLAFFYDPEMAGSMNHVGIVVGWDEDGALLVAHCSSGAGTVIVSDAADYGFQYIRTPGIYENEDYITAAYSNRNLGSLLVWNACEEVAAENAVLGDLTYTDIVTWSDVRVGTGIVIGRNQDGALMVAYGDGENTVVATADEAGFTQFRRAESMKSVRVGVDLTGSVVLPETEAQSN